MAVLNKVNILANQRLDLPDLQNIDAFVADDFNALIKYFFSKTSKILSGFQVFQDASCLVNNPTTSIS